MSIELDIEESLVNHLSTELSEIKCEAIGNMDFNDKELIARAQRKPKGYVIVQYMGTEAETRSENSTLYKLNATFTLYCFTKSRKGHDGIYELLDSIRSKTIAFEYEKHRMIFIRDAMHPFPVSDGLFMSELQFELIQMRRF
jgi:hypothetical protein